MKSAFAAALAAAIGFFLGYSIQPHWLAGFVGLFAGGILGYIFADSAGFFAAFPKAWQSLTRERDYSSLPKRLAVCGWGVLAVVSLLTSTFIVLCGLFALIGTSMFTVNEAKTVGLLFGAVFVGTSTLTYLPDVFKKDERDLDNSIASSKEMVRISNPFAMFYVIATKVLPKIPGILLGVLRFCYALFMVVIELTTSNERITGLLGGATGAVVGFYYLNDSAVVGVLGSGVVGFVTAYGLALLGKRLVKAT